MDINETLLQFRVYDNQQGGDVPYVNSKHKKYQTLFYLIGLVLAEITWIIISINYHSNIEIYTILFIVLSWALIWSTIGYKLRFMYKGQYIFWIHTCYHIFMFALALVTPNHHFILCGSSTGIIFFVALQAIILRNLVSSKIYFYLYIWYALIYYDNMKRIQYKAQVNWLMMGMMDIYLIYGIVVFLLLFKKWYNLSKYARFQLLCLLFPLSIILVFCIAGTFPEKTFNFKWNWLTIINHVVYIYLCYFIIRNTQILPFICKKQEDKIQPFDNRQILYQNSDTLLVDEHDYMGDPRQSMKGSPPLALCTLCQDKQCSFCYHNCKHAVICIDCAHDWLSNGDMKKCPFCRAQSQFLLYIQRIQGIAFAVNGKYRFKSRT